METLTPRIKWHARRIRLNKDGYDSGGGYWGVGKPLYHVYADFISFDYYVRASSAKTAKELARLRYYEFDRRGELDA